jgi:hypothetical protein
MCYESFQRCRGKGKGKCRLTFQRIVSELRDFQPIRSTVDLMGGPDRDRTEHLFHAMKSALNISPTYKTPVAT